MAEPLSKRVRPGSPNGPVHSTARQMKATSAVPGGPPLTKRAYRSWCFFVDLVLGSGQDLAAWTVDKGMDSWEVEGVNDDSEEDEESGGDEESMAMDTPRGGTPPPGDAPSAANEGNASASNAHGPVVHTHGTDGADAPDTTTTTGGEGAGGSGNPPPSDGGAPSGGGGGGDGGGGGASEEGAVADDDCSICKGALGTGGGPITTIACGHRFH